jgi:hypothetical protein
MGVVTGETLNIRAAPRLGAPIVGATYHRHLVTILDRVTGDPLVGVSLWYRIGPERYVSAADIEPFVPPVPPETYDGHWVDVNLSQFYAVAYDGDQPVYAAIITAGREDDQTPHGVFQIFYRVREETMDAATVGIPEGHPDYYRYEHVQFAQYFQAGGYALHQNYWTPPEQFGSFSSSGCIGLLESDAAWFWEFLANGSTVSIHF